MADRIERMKARQEAMRQKEAARREKEEAERRARMDKIKAKNPQKQSIGATSAGSSEEPTKIENHIALRKNFYSPQPKTERGKPVLIGGDPKDGDKIVYCVGSDVIIRSLSNPAKGEIYTEHPRATTVARLSPDGKFVASGDITGVVRVWNTQTIQGKPYKIELERPCLGGPPADIAWGPESKRVAVVGESKGTMGHVFFVNGGNACGALTGASKRLTSVAFRQVKPFTMVALSEDLSYSFYTGPPFKWKHSKTVNSRYPNCVRFNPSGSAFCVAAQDKKIWIGNGDNGEKTQDFDIEHKGGVYCCSWSPDGQQILTSSGDKTCKIWDANSGKSVTTVNFGSDVMDQQVGCLWQGSYLIALSLSGQIKYIDPNSGKVTQVLEGHQKEIKSCTYHKPSNSIYTGSYTSRVVRWNVDSGETDLVETGHKNSVISMECVGDDVVTASFDDTFKVNNGTSNKSSSAIGARPFNMGASRGSGVAAIGTYSEQVHLVKDGTIVSSVDVKYRPLALAVSPDGSKVAVGGNDKQVHIFDVSGTSLKESKTLTGHAGNVTALSFSGDGKHLASADRKIIVWSTSDFSRVSYNEWIFHTAKVNNMEWSPNGRYLASVGLDTLLIVWDLENRKKKCYIQASHHGAANDCTWVDDATVATVGADSSLKTWNVKFE